MPEAQGDSKPTKAPEVVASNPERKSEKLQSPKVPRKIGFRKQIAGRIVGAAMALSAIGIPADNPNQNLNFSSVYKNNPEIVQSLSVQDLERMAERLYQIQIVSPEEKKAIELSNGAIIETAEWNKEEITNFMRVLDKLPHNFYSPDPGGIPVNFIVSDIDPQNLNKGGMPYGALCSCRPNSKIPEVVFTRKGFRNFYDMSIIITHELTHRVSTSKDDKFMSQLLGVPDNVDFGEFSNDNFVNKIDTLQLIDALENAGFNKYAVQNMFRYGLHNPDEFTSVASQFYIGGKENFLKLYGVYIGDEKAQRLYDYMKNKIFKGKEYSNDREYFQFH